MDKVAMLTQGLKKLAAKLPELTFEERAVPYVVGEPLYRAIYAPHGKKLEEYAKGQSRISTPSLIGALLGLIGGGAIAHKFYGPKHLVTGALLGALPGGQIGQMIKAPSAPFSLRESLGEKEK